MTSIRVHASGLLLAVLSLSGWAAPAAAGGKPAFCTMTANTLLSACRASASDDNLVRRAVCTNVADTEARKACLAESAEMNEEALDLCTEQRAGRVATCKLLGQGRYDPDISPSRFDDPARPSQPNPYFPLTVGHRWEYRAGNEVNTVEVVDETKLIAGVRCAVVRDLVSRDGFIAEATDDWYVPAKDGAVWYFGEEVKNYQTFAGDMPVRPELDSIDGSFKAGRDGDKAGIIFLAAPKVGDAYVEEASLGNAEDVTVILSTNYSYGGGAAELDELVPPALAQRFCHGDCVVTRNFSLLEPGIFARKYYAPGIGVFLEVEPDENQAIRLTGCNFDPRCDGLPQ
ncbi:MAG: hypothetical protein U0802_19370 [Candidatus Binatia bacterium]